MNVNIFSCRNTARGDMHDSVRWRGEDRECSFLMPDPQSSPHSHYDKKLVVVGAGPVGCLAAIALANMGWVVEIYEARPGIPLFSTSPHSTGS